MRFTSSPRIPFLPVLALALLLPAIATGSDAKSPADYVNPLIDTHKSRWFYFSSACRPFGMVNLSPDTRTGDDWLHGYLYEDTKIRCFSHIHGWQLYGVAVMPTCGEMHGHLGMDAYASDFSHEDEVVRAGYHKVVLRSYGITAELTSTTRVGFHRYTFPGGQTPHVLFDAGAKLMAPITSSQVRRTSDRELVGQAVMAPTPRRPKPFTAYFIAQFDQPFAKFGGWSERKLLGDSVEGVSGANVGAYVSFANASKQPLLLKVAISYVGVEAARRNLAAELPHWDFDCVVRESRDDWNRQLGRIEIEGGTESQRIKFYTDLWQELAYGDITPFGGYNGDEDQGQMGALGALMAIGLFDVQGGAALKPTYQITSPLFDRVVIHLEPAYSPGRQFTIVCRDNSPKNIYIQSATLNSRPLEPCWFDHAQLVAGGTLGLQLGPEPNRKWGLPRGKKTPPSLED